MSEQAGPTPAEDRLSIAEEALSRVLSAEIKEILTVVQATRVENNPYLVRIPDSSAVDLPPHEIDSLIARASNSYGRIARLAGIARANAKLSKGRYERKYKTHKVGKNAEERERNAMEASVNEHQMMTMADSLAEMAEGLENGARVASESARKLKKAVDAQHTAAGREGMGAYAERDWT